MVIDLRKGMNTVDLRERPVYVNDLRIYKGRRLMIDGHADPYGAEQRKAFWEMIKKSVSIGNDYKRTEMKFKKHWKK